MDKEYFAEIEGLVTEEDVQIFASGFALTNDEQVKPSKLLIDEINEANQTSKIRLVIQEGKFHQVKRMFEAVDKRVVYLKRLRMGSLVLDEQLPLGAYRPLTETELQEL